MNLGDYSNRMEQSFKTNFGLLSNPSKKFDLNNFTNYSDKYGINLEGNLKSEIEPPKPVIKNQYRDNIAKQKLGNNATMQNVEATQRMLSDLGLYKGQIDGMWGKNTQSAYDLYNSYKNNPKLFKNYVYNEDLTKLKNDNYHYYLGKDGNTYRSGIDGMISKYVNLSDVEITGKTGDYSINNKLNIKTPEVSLNELKTPASAILDNKSLDKFKINIETKSATAPTLTSTLVKKSNIATNENYKYVKPLFGGNPYYQHKDKGYKVYEDDKTIKYLGLQGTVDFETGKVDWGKYMVDGLEIPYDGLNSITERTRAEQRFVDDYLKIKPKGNASKHRRNASMISGVTNIYNKKTEGKMITKNLQGGTLSPEQQELQFALIGYVVATKKQPKDENEIKQIAQALVQLKLQNPELYTLLVQLGQQSLQQGIKAKLGAKLNYIKKMKGICSEGEELYYFKRGGGIDCGCRKKLEKKACGSKLKKKRK